MAHRILSRERCRRRSRPIGRKSQVTEAWKELGAAERTLELLLGNRPRGPLTPAQVADYEHVLAEKQARASSKSAAEHLARTEAEHERALAELAAAKAEG